MSPEDWGIASEYWDNYGQQRKLDDATRERILAAMRVEVPVRDAVDVRVVREGVQCHDLPTSQIELEDDTTFEISGELPDDLPLGYHWLTDLSSGRRTRLIKAPTRCHFDDSMRIAAFAAQLYAVRSKSSWGHGDLSDARRLGAWLAEKGMGALLINPIHAVAPVSPQQPSPYYPTTRRFRNPLYLDMSLVPGADMLPDFAKRANVAQQLNSDRRIDRDRVLQYKLDALDAIWQMNRDPSGLNEFCREMGPSLECFATYCVLAEQFGGIWQQWPQEYQDPASPEVAKFRAEHADRVRWHQWLQMLLDQQLADAGRALPLVQDLPIGVDPGGADAWQWQGELANGVTVGAPPDHFSTQGQNWALPPFVPHRLRARGYAPFIETIRATLRHAGGLRIDHVMGLFRLFWIPANCHPKDGAYVRYRGDEMLAIVALESQRAGAWIAGEDLGTVEPHVREQLAANAMLAYRLVWFEDAQPNDFPHLSMASITTHDLPTVAGLWQGTDWDDQASIGMQPDRHHFDLLKHRLRCVAETPDDTSTKDVIVKAHRALSHSPAAVAVANVDDAIGVTERPNMPGTVDEWPNWRIALPKSLEEVTADPLANEVADVLRR